MKFISVDGSLKRVAHTSGVIEMIGKDPVELPVFDESTRTGYAGLMECAMAAGCVPFMGKGQTLPGTASGFDVAMLESEKAELKEAKADLEEAHEFLTEKANDLTGKTDALAIERAAFEKEKSDFALLKEANIVVNGAAAEKVEEKPVDALVIADAIVPAPKAATTKAKVIIE